jgi:uncharacterized protein (DUF169 family)
MKPLKTDLSIFKKFNFENAPVGVKFLFSKPEGIEHLEKTLPLCQMIREAQERKTPFYMTKENEDCFGSMVLGMVDVPPFAEAGLLGEKFEIFQEDRANARLYEYVPKIKRNTVNFVAFSIMDKMTFEPDILMLMGTPRQAEIVLRAMSYSTGELWEAKKTPVLGCAWLYAYPFKTGKVNHVVTGMSFGMIAKEVFKEGWVVVAIPWDWIPTIIANLKEMKWDLPAYTEGREKFYQRKGRVIGESVKAMEDVMAVQNK